MQHIKPNYECAALPTELYRLVALHIHEKWPASQLSQLDFMSWLMVLESDLQICKLGDMGPAAALEEIEQDAGGAHQDPLLREAGFGHQTVTVVKITKGKCHVGIGAEGEVSPQISRSFHDGAAVAFTPRARVNEGGVVDLQRHPIVRSRLDHRLNVDGKCGVARVADHIDPAALDGVDHRLGVGCLIAGREYLLMKTRHDHVEARLIALGKIDLPLQVFDVGLDTPQDPYPVHHSWQYRQVGKVPDMRGIGHLGPVIRGGEQLDPLGPGYRQIVVDGAVCMGAGNGVSVGIDRVLHLLSPHILKGQHNKVGGIGPRRHLPHFVTKYRGTDIV